MQNKFDHIRALVSPKKQDPENPEVIDMKSLSVGSQAIWLPKRGTLITHRPYKSGAPGDSSITSLTGMRDDSRKTLESFNADGQKKDLGEFILRGAALGMGDSNPLIFRGDFAILDEHSETAETATYHLAVVGAHTQEPQVICTYDTCGAVDVTIWDKTSWFSGIAL